METPMTGETVDDPASGLRGWIAEPTRLTTGLPDTNIGLTNFPGALGYPGLKEINFDQQT